jgi:hypothetical protein
VKKKRRTNERKIKLQQPTVISKNEKIIKFISKKWFELITLIVAIVALRISVRNQIVAEQAFNFSREQYMFEKLPIWIGEVNQEKEEIHLYSYKDDIILQNATVYFPTKIDDTIWTITPPDYTLPVTVLKSSLTKFVNENVKRVKNNFILNDEWIVPIIIESNYIVDGLNYNEDSLYFISYQFIITDKKYDMPDIIIKGVYFDSHINKADNAGYVNEIWNYIIENQIEK